MASPLADASIGSRPHKGSAQAYCWRRQSQAANISNSADVDGTQPKEATFELQLSCQRKLPERAPILWMRAQKIATGLVQMFR